MALSDKQKKINDYSMNYMRERRNDPEFREAENARQRLRRKKDPQQYVLYKLRELKEIAEKKGISLNDVIKKEYDATKMNDTVKNISVKKIKHSVKQVKTDEPAQRVCIFCGEFFKPIRVTAKYCSDNCRVKYNYRNKRKE